MFNCCIYTVRNLTRCLFLTLLCVPAAHSETLRLPMVTDSTGIYVDGLVKLALARIDTKYELTYDTEALYTPRELEKLEKSKISLYWSATTSSYEERFRPVRIPLFRGLMGYRILMIRKGEQHRFNGIKSLNELHRVSIGQGRYWTDTEILEANGIEVTQALKYEGLFHMLDGGRFDAFPRGIHEPWGEIASLPELSLAVEENIALIYRMPFYIFLKKDNLKLAEELETGLMNALQDGSFENHFYNDPKVKQVLEKANIKNRINIHLINPSLNVETPIDRPELWLSPKDL